MRRSNTSRFYRFFIRKTRFTKMHMHIAKTGKKNVFPVVEGIKSFKAVPDKMHGTIIADLRCPVEYLHRVSSKKNLAAKDGKTSKG